MDSANRIRGRRRLADLRKTIQFAEFEMMVALLSFSMLASYASEPESSESLNRGPLSTLQGLARLIRAQEQQTLGSR